MTNPADNASERQIIVSRLLDVPRERVWEAWTDPDSITHWWGPRGFSTTTHQMSLQPGGVWRFTMHGPDGRDYANRVTYLDVDRPRLLSYRHAGEGDDAGVQFVSRVTFDEVDRCRTRLTLCMTFPSAEVRDTVARDYGAVEGAQQTLLRLDEHLGQAVESAQAPAF